MAKVPDYLTLTMNKAGRVDIDGVISKAYRIEVSRLVKEIENGNFNNINLDNCQYVTAVTQCDDNFYDTDSDYIVKKIDGKIISIDFCEEDDCILVTVKNSGCTLEDTELTHIFESFFRGKNASNEKGSGLGLYICRQLINKMNGEIFAKISEGCMCVTIVFRKA